MYCRQTDRVVSANTIGLLGDLWKVTDLLSFIHKLLTLTVLLLVIKTIANWGSVMLNSYAY